MQPWFIQLPILPVVYFVILMTVVSAGALAKLLGPMLLRRTSGTVHRFLSHPVGLDMTGDRLGLYLFQRTTLIKLSIQLFLSLDKNLDTQPNNSNTFLRQDSGLLLKKLLIPEKYWSGIPPNPAGA